MVGYSLQMSGDWLEALAAVLHGMGQDPAAVVPDALGAALAPLVQRADCPRAVEIGGGTAGYRRYALRRVSGSGFDCVLIVWSAAARAPLHDHGGLWGVELVLDGALGVDEFTASALAVARRAQPRCSRLLGPGDAVSFGTHDYAHRWRNLSTRAPALSLHVYGGTLAHYRVFRRDAGAGHRAHTAPAAIDAVLP